MSSKPDIKPAIAPNPAATAEAPPPPPHDAMRRLQIGIAGVLTVLLLVGMAGLIGDRARERAAADPDTAAEVKVPGADESATQRARRILEELRKRLGDPLRPAEELDYLERLLRRN